jgi:hypothetical protein
MISNIARFRAEADARKGFQRLNRFRLKIATPPGLLNQRSVNAQQPALVTASHLEFWGMAADLPGVALTTRSIVRYGYGASEKKPSAPSFNDVVAYFYNDQNSINLNFFQDWLNYIVDFDMSQSITRNGVYEVQYKKNYAVDAEFTLVDNTGNDTYTIVMRDLFPTAIPETKFSMDPAPTMMMVVVMFSFTDWSIKRNQRLPPAVTGG